MKIWLLHHGCPYICWLLPYLLLSPLLALPAAVYMHGHRLGLTRVMVNAVSADAAIFPSVCRSVFRRPPARGWKWCGAQCAAQALLLPPSLPPFQPATYFFATAIIFKLHTIVFFFAFCWLLIYDMEGSLPWESLPPPLAIYIYVYMFLLHVNIDIHYCYSDIIIIALFTMSRWYFLLIFVIIFTQPLLLPLIISPLRHNNTIRHIIIIAIIVIDIYSGQKELVKAMTHTYIRYDTYILIWVTYMKVRRCCIILHIDWPYYYIQMIQGYRLGI